MKYFPKLYYQGRHLIFLQLYFKFSGVIWTTIFTVHYFSLFFLAIVCINILPHIVLWHTGLFNLLKNINHLYFNVFFALIKKIWSWFYLKEKSILCFWNLCISIWCVIKYIYSLFVCFLHRNLKLSIKRSLYSRNKYNLFKRILDPLKDPLQSFSS